MSAYYNEFDPYAAAWLRELIARDLISPGDVDERSVEDVTPNDIKGYSQHHFFAGIGGWSLALRLAGVPDNYPVWTGSPPCQPFSTAGDQRGFDDSRHLWPAFAWLISQCLPAKIIGEQVASKNTNQWFDLVQTDLEGMGYAFGLVPFPAAGIGAPHIRDRAYWFGDSGRTVKWMADNERIGREVALQYSSSSSATTRIGSPDVGRSDGTFGRMEHPDQQRCGEKGNSKSGERTGINGTPSRMADRCNEKYMDTRGIIARPLSSGPFSDFWRDTDWVYCRDDKWRPVESGTFPVVNGIPKGVVPSGDISLPSPEANVMRLKGYGNAIVPEQAALFIQVALSV